MRKVSPFRDAEVGLKRGAEGMIEEVDDGCRLRTVRTRASHPEVANGTPRSYGATVFGSRSLSNPYMRLAAETRSGTPEITRVMRSLPRRMSIIRPTDVA